MTTKRARSIFTWLYSMMMLFLGFEMGGFQLFLSDISREFQMTQTGMGSLVAAQYGSIIIMPLLFGQLSDKLGKRAVIIGGTAAFVLGCLLIVLSASSGLFIAGIFFVGAGFSVCESVGAAFLSDMYSGAARYINISQCALSIGAILGPLVLSSCAARPDVLWRALFLICGASFLLLMLALLPLKLPENQAAAERQGGHTMASYFRSPVFVMLLAAIFLYVGLENGIGYFAKSLFDIRLSAADMGAYAISAYWAGMALSRILGSLKTPPPYPALILCFAASCMLFTVLALSGYVYLSLAACMLVGAAFGPIWPTLAALSAKEFPQNSGGAVGLFSSGCGLGGAVFPVFMGLISDWLDVGFAFFLLAAAALLGGLFCIRARALSKKRMLD